MTRPESIDRLQAAACAIPEDRRSWHAWDRGIGYEVHHGEVCLDDERLQRSLNGDPPATPWDSCEAVNSEFRETFPRAAGQYIAMADPVTILGLLDYVAELERLAGVQHD